jgi:hypothetical protein
MSWVYLPQLGCEAALVLLSICVREVTTADHSAMAHNFTKTLLIFQCIVYKVK